MTIEAVLANQARQHIEVGHVVDALRSMPAKSVHCVIYSPPYWGLRAYNTPPQVWGGRSDCAHDFDWYDKPALTGGTNGNVQTKGGANSAQVVPSARRETCRTCNAWLGEHGQEPLHDCLSVLTGGEPCGRCFVCNHVTILRGVWRVLRDDGACFIVIGDSWAGGGGVAGIPDGYDSMNLKDREKYPAESPMRNARKLGLKRKDRAGVPERLTLAAQADGWYWRDTFQWIKGISGAKRMGAVMPESVTDRLTKAHEDIIFLTKNESYYFDMEAVKESYTESSSMGNTGPKTNVVVAAQDSRAHRNDGPSNHQYGSGGQPRNVLYFPIEPMRDAHFAPMPSSIPDFLVRATTSEYGVCAKCAAPWERVREKQQQGNSAQPSGKYAVLDEDGTHHGQNSRRGAQGSTFHNNPRCRPRIYPAAALPSPPFSWRGKQMLADEHDNTVRLGANHDATRAAGAPHDNPFQVGTGRADLEHMRGEDGHLHWGDNHPNKNPDKWQPKFVTLGWQPTCECPTDVIPAVVLDPFAGSGTTIMAALQLGRRAIGIDLNPQYVNEIAAKRVAPFNNRLAEDVL